jgi:hypothetical protein
VLVGSDDTRTPPFVSEKYVALLKARGIAASLTESPQADHDAAFRSRTTLIAALELMKPQFTAGRAYDGSLLRCEFID